MAPSSGSIVHDGLDRESIHTVFLPRRTGFTYMLLIGLSVLLYIGSAEWTKRAFYAKMGYHY